MVVERLPLGCKPVDELLGGGVETSSLTSVYGPAGVGKTCFAIQASVNCLNAGKRVVFIDTEGGFSPERFEQIAGQPMAKDLVLLEPKNFKEQESSIASLAQLIDPSVGLVVVDSLVTLYRLEMSPENYQEINNKLALQLSQLSKISREKGVPVILTNQVYEDIDKGSLELVSRDVVKYWVKCLLELRKTGMGKRAAIIRKHRSRPEGEETEFSITQKGIEETKRKIF